VGEVDKSGVFAPGVYGQLDGEMLFAVLEGRPGEKSRLKPGASAPRRATRISPGCISTFAMPRLAAPPPLAA
jgi:hypothetical protein